ncbi:MAG: hypothetical protein A2Y63_03060 [Candidatus Riflebacteria bacterium RBG_13_59_9]|nr:MAG: hypothetical protein A2Y63_03060 [Candidatus Riflebacteria bacterium RBG_13_59_9]
MALTLWRVSPALLLQGGDLDETLKWILVGAIVLCILAMGFQFFKNTFYAITAPTYSLRNMGEDDNFFFSILLVFLGGLFAAFYTFIQRNFIAGSFESFAKAQVEQALASYSNLTYKPVVASYGIERMTDVFESLETIIVWIPVLWLVSWLVMGVLYWLLSRAFGNQSPLKVMLSSLAYFFMLYGAVAGYFIAHALGTSFLASVGTPPIGAVEIIGALLGLVFFVYLIVAISQGGEITPAQAGVAWLVWGIVIGGAIAATVYYKVIPSFEAFLNGLSTSSYV